MMLFVTKWDFILLLYLSTVYWLVSTFTLCFVQESINDEVIADATLSLDVGERGHFSNDICLENGNDFEENDMCNDWAEASVCHLSEMDEECLGVFSVSMFIIMMIIYKLCDSYFLLTEQMKSKQIKPNNESDDHISHLQDSIFVQELIAPDIVSKCSYHLVVKQNIQRKMLLRKRMRNVQEMLITISFLLMSYIICWKVNEIIHT